MAATKIGRWSEARNDLVSALDRLTEEARPTFVLGLKADSILCRYMMGEHAEAIADFGSLLDELEELQAAYEEEPLRSEEHTSELQSLMRISYAVFCLKQQKKHEIDIDVSH